MGADMVWISGDDVSLEPGLEYGGSWVCSFIEGDFEGTFYCGLRMERGDQCVVKQKYGWPGLLSVDIDS